MKLTHVHPGDIVRVDDGLPGRAQAPRTVKAAWVVDHWRHARTSASGGGVPRP